MPELNVFGADVNEGEPEIKKRQEPARKQGRRSRSVRDAHTIAAADFSRGASGLIGNDTN